MNIQGLDYNTRRTPIVLPEYGREIQLMIEHAISLPRKEQRQQCAETIIRIMKRMIVPVGKPEDFEQRLWHHLALISGFRLDIDFPFEIKPSEEDGDDTVRIPYPDNKIKVRHYGKLLFGLFEKLKTMPEGPEKDKLAQYTANQMKHQLTICTNGSANNNKVMADLEKYTDGSVRLDPETFRFDKSSESKEKNDKKKKKK